MINHEKLERTRNHPSLKLPPTLRLRRTSWMTRGAAPPGTACDFPLSSLRVMPLVSVRITRRRHNLRFAKPTWFGRAYVTFPRKPHRFLASLGCNDLVHKDVFAHRTQTRIWGRSPQATDTARSARVLGAHTSVRTDANVYLARVAWRACSLC